MTEFKLHFLVFPKSVVLFKINNDRYLMNYLSKVQGKMPYTTIMINFYSIVCNIEYE